MIYKINTKFMVRFNMSIYKAPINDKELYEAIKHKISILHSSAKIKESIIGEEYVITIHSSAENEFISHFIELNHTLDELDDNLKTVKKSLDEIILNRLNNNKEIYYCNIIRPTISMSDIYKVIKNTPEICSYIFLENTFLLCIFDESTNFTSVLEFTSNRISDGWSPKFDIDDGFYDFWYADLRKNELKILNECYSNWSVDKLLFSDLQHID